MEHEQVIHAQFVRAGKIKSDNKDPRRNQERRDFNMISEDHSAMANLPRMAQHYEFPKEGGYFIPMWD
jgi:hypothetical protein